GMVGAVRPPDRRRPAARRPRGGRGIGWGVPGPDPRYPRTERFFIVTREFDLLGHPIPENFGKPGRNGHIVTPESVMKVRRLVLAGMDAKEVAAELGISAPTVRKHYFPKGPIRNAARRFLVEQRARMLTYLDEAAAEGNVAAIKEMLKQLDAMVPAIQGEASEAVPVLPAAGRIGKKASRQIAAEARAAGGGKYAPPAAPKLVVSNGDS
ncbi:hypothetical protein, partial [Mangrovicoccus sp. HB161399]|uniref:hypothetical protein n=1 Tax=Mangrovicoccus sp. HB161399 TaxID=2720392 RepID=UPI001C12DB21